MPWPLEEEAKSQTKLLIVAAFVSGAGGIFTSAWTTWSVWVSVRGGERTVGSARDTLQLFVVLGLAAFAYSLLTSRGTGPHTPLGRRLRMDLGFALLASVAIPAAAMMALPASAPPTAAQGR